MKQEILMIRSAIKRQDDKVVGIGGMKCCCCTIGQPRVSKRLISKRQRRYLHQQLKRVDADN